MTHMVVERNERGAVTITMYAIAEPGTLFAPSAAEHWSGRPVPVTLPDGGALLGYVEAAKVVDDGKAIEVRVRLPQNEPRHQQFVDRMLS